MKNSPQIVSAAVLFSMLMTGGASAAPSQGEQLAAQCAQCHGTNGSGGFEQLAGQSSSSIYQELLSMKAHSTPEGIMDYAARGYTDEQLWLISEYFSSLSRNSDTKTNPRSGCNPKSKSPKC